MRHVLLLLALALPSATGCAGPRAAAGYAHEQTLAPGLTLHYTTAPFDASRYEVVTDDSGYVLGTVGCDQWHGSDGGVPEIVVTAGWVVRDGQRLDLDTSCMGSYDPGPDARDEPIGDFAAEPLAEPGTWQVSGRFSDGAGTAEVVWTVGATSTTRDRLVSGPALFEP
jgi:hypothetical protein